MGGVEKVGGGVEKGGGGVEKKRWGVEKIGGGVEKIGSPSFFVGVVCHVSRRGDVNSVNVTFDHQLQSRLARDSI